MQLNTNGVTRSVTLHYTPGQKPTIESTGPRNGSQLAANYDFENGEWAWWLWRRGAVAPELHSSFDNPPAVSNSAQIEGPAAYDGDSGDVHVPRPSIQQAIATTS